ncbi:DUF5683 domain-containing protein [Pontibacter chitinilyticus]|uniref:DUF5683 domain-containing protein n=1 Tax=Pontibacter chitinilyticus TaxID=2674989 RepID=UPI0032195E0D
MRLTIGATALLLSITLYFTAAPAFGQLITEGLDSVVVPVSDTLNLHEGFFLSRWDKPAKAAFFSAVFPGGGQIYNKSYWKLPIIYATAAVLGYYWIDNNNKYQDFRKATIQRADSSDRYINDPIYGINTPRGTKNLRYSRDFYRRNRDLTILLSIGAYGLQIAEAYVHAHMKQFDISDDLSLRVQPDLLRVPQLASYTPGVTLTLYNINPKTKE